MVRSGNAKHRSIFGCVVSPDLMVIGEITRCGGDGETNFSERRVAQRLFIDLDPICGMGVCIWNVRLLKT